MRTSNGITGPPPHAHSSPFPLFHALQSDALRDAVRLVRGEVAATLRFEFEREALMLRDAVSEHYFFPLEFFSFLCFVLCVRACYLCFLIWVLFTCGLWLMMMERIDNEGRAQR